MHNYYIINEKIEFHPETGMLQQLGDSESIILNSPASRCFLLLIHRAGHIVSQQEFMDEVWMKSGALVSPNTFYQNISILRKGLKKIGLKEEIIITIPRIGLTLAHECHIQELTAEQLSLSNHHTAETSQKSLSFDKHSVKEEGVQHHAKQQGSEALSHSLQAEQPSFFTTQKSALLKVTASILNWQYLSITSFAMWLLLLILITFLLVQTLYPPNELQHYIRTSDIGDCKVFLSPAQAMYSMQENSLDYAKKFSDECNKYPWIYVDTIPHLPRILILRCSQANGITGVCISDYFIQNLEYQ